MSVLNNELPLEQQIEILLKEWIIGNKGHRAVLVRLYDDSDSEEDVKTQVINAGNKVLLLHGILGECYDETEYLGKVVAKIIENEKRTTE